MTEHMAPTRPLGAHMSTQGGLPRAVERAQRVQATALQVFTKNQLQWAPRLLPPTEVDSFRRATAGSALRYVCAHAGYLINPASPSNALWEKSKLSLVEELRRAEVLGCACPVLHPGSPKDDGRDAGLERVVTLLDKAFEATSGGTAKIALENTAGQGNTLGATFAELATVVNACSCPERLVVCLDTCHAFAAGYDLRTPQGVRETISEIERVLGLDRLALLHLNDSKGECGSRLDRHEHIGRGQIGIEGFRALLSDLRLTSVPAIIETHKDKKTLREDRRNLRLLRSLEAHPNARECGRRVTDSPALIPDLSLSEAEEAED